MTAAVVDRWSAAVTAAAGASTPVISADRGCPRRTKVKLIGNGFAALRTLDARGRRNRLWTDADDASGAFSARSSREASAPASPVRPHPRRHRRDDQRRCALHGDPRRGRAISLYRRGSPPALRDRISRCWGFSLAGARRAGLRELRRPVPASRPQLRTRDDRRAMSLPLRTRARRVFPFSPSVRTSTLRSIQSKRYVKHPSGSGEPNPSADPLSGGIPLRTPSSIKLSPHSRRWMTRSRCPRSGGRRGAGAGGAGGRGGGAGRAGRRGGRAGGGAGRAGGRAAGGRAGGGGGRRGQEGRAGLAAAEDGRDVRGAAGEGGASTSSSRAMTTASTSATPTRCSTRSRSSSPARAGFMNPERILTTVMFTDIVRSTETAARAPSATAAGANLISDHDRLMHDQITVYRGGRSGAPATACSPRSTAPPGRSVVRWPRSTPPHARCRDPCRRTGECRSRAMTSPGSRSTSGADQQTSRSRVRCVSGTVRDLVVGSNIMFDYQRVEALAGVPGEWRSRSPATAAPTAAPEAAPVEKTMRRPACRAGLDDTGSPARSSASSPSAASTRSSRDQAALPGSAAPTRSTKRFSMTRLTGERRTSVVAEVPRQRPRGVGQLDLDPALAHPADEPRST